MVWRGFQMLFHKKTLLSEVQRGATLVDTGHVRGPLSCLEHSPRFWVNRCLMGLAWLLLLRGMGYVLPLSKQIRCLEAHRDGVQWGRCRALCLGACVLEALAEPLEQSLGSLVPRLINASDDFSWCCRSQYVVGFCGQVPSFRIVLLISLKSLWAA